jgi:hypothetical protein
MSLQQAEGRKLWKKSMRMRRQALIRAIASILVMLLTGTGLLGTPAYGESPRCGFGTFLKCSRPHIWPNGQEPEECRKCLEGRPKALVRCPDGSTRSAMGECLPKPPARKLVNCPKGSILTEYEDDSKKVIEVCNPLRPTDPEGNPLPDPDPGCVIGYDEDSKRVIQVCDDWIGRKYLPGLPPDRWNFIIAHPPCKTHHMNDWLILWSTCVKEENRKNRERCGLPQSFYIPPLYKERLEPWEPSTLMEGLQCVLKKDLPACRRVLVRLGVKKLVNEFVPSTWEAYDLTCFDADFLDQVCQLYATVEVCIHTVTPGPTVGDPGLRVVPGPSLRVVPGPTVIGNDPGR